MTKRSANWIATRNHCDGCKKPLHFNMKYKYYVCRHCNEKFSFDVIGDIKNMKIRKPVFSTIVGVKKIKEEPIEEESGEIEEAEIPSNILQCNDCKEFFDDFELDINGICPECLSK